MSWEGKTPTTAIDNDITPSVANQCSCGQELVYVSASENPPMTRADKEMQFHCMISRAGDWFFCIDQMATWIRVKDED